MMMSELLEKMEHVSDLLNFAKDEAVKINVIRKEMEQELERIKLIGKEPEVESEDVMKTVYIGRDRNGGIYMHLSKPIRFDGEWESKEGDYFDLENADVKLPYLTWDDEPLEYKLLEKEKTILHADFAVELRKLFKEYGVTSLHAMSSEAKITESIISGFHINKTV